METKNFTDSELQVLEQGLSLVNKVSYDFCQVTPKCKDCPFNLVCETLSGIQRDVLKEIIARNLTIERIV